MGRIAHSTRIPASAVSEQLHPSIAVVCIAPAVLPLEKALTSRSCSVEYPTAATPRLVSTEKGQVPTLACAPSLCPRYSAVRPSVTAYSQSVRPTTTVGPANTASAASRSGIITPAPDASHRGGDPPRTDSTIRNATLTQLSIASPRLDMPAARKLKKGARSGVHMSTANWSPAACSWHRTAVACGITATSCSAAFTTLCTASVRCTSSSGYSRMSSGAASVPQKACPSCAPSRLNSRTASMLGNRFRTPRSGCRQAVPRHRKLVNQSTRASLRPCTSETSAPAIRTTISAWSSSTGSRPCTASVLRNQTALFHTGSTPRSTRSSICSGSSTTWFAYGPTNWLYMRAPPIHVSGNSVNVTYIVEKSRNTRNQNSHHRRTACSMRVAVRTPVPTELVPAIASAISICFDVYRLNADARDASDARACSSRPVRLHAARERPNGIDRSSIPAAMLFLLWYGIAGRFYIDAGRVLRGHCSIYSRSGPRSVTQSMTRLLLFLVLAVAVAQAVLHDDSHLNETTLPSINISFVKEVTLTIAPQDLALSPHEEQEVSSLLESGLRLLDPIMRFFEGLAGGGAQAHR
jgi:hypothetical protein